MGEVLEIEVGLRKSKVRVEWGIDKGTGRVLDEKKEVYSEGRHE